MDVDARIGIGIGNQVCMHIVPWTFEGASRALPGHPVPKSPTRSQEDDVIVY